MQGEVGRTGEIRRGDRPSRTAVAAQITPYLLIAPAGVFLAVFFAWPMVQALGLAVRDESGTGWTLESLRRMATDVQFVDALRNTILLTAIVVPAQVILALVMSLLLMTGLRGTSALLYAWMIPLGISDLAAGVVWLSIFTDRGYLNSLIVGMGLNQTGFSFLSYENPAAMFLAVTVAETWRATALVMTILLAGLQVIPKDYAEAAEVFGAGFWQRLRYVTLPLLKPSLQVALIIRTILAFQVFAVVVALAGRNLPVLAGEAYTWYSGYGSPTVAAAYALLIMLFSLANTVLYLRALRTRGEQTVAG